MIVSIANVNSRELFVIPDYLGFIATRPTPVSMMAHEYRDDSIYNLGQ